MNIVFFSLKRAYYSTLRFTRRALARLGLTAARFDLLYILQKSDGFMLQSELQRALGVARPTVSRMLASLQELGLIKREILQEDRRHREVKLTKTGRRCVLTAARLLIHTGRIQLAIDSAIARDQWTAPLECELACGQLDSTLCHLRRAFHDRATRDYPWTFPYDLFIARPLWFTAPEEDI
jgi:DNA-binding MarR family transcriptional regulator